MVGHFQQPPLKVVYFMHDLFIYHTGTISYKIDIDKYIMFVV